MKNHKLFLSMGLVVAGLSMSVDSYACANGTYGVGVQGSSQSDSLYYVNVYAGNGKYNKTLPVSKNQYQEFCWDAKLGNASVTKTSSDSHQSKKYKWPVPDKAGYKTVYIDSNNWS